MVPSVAPTEQFPPRHLSIPSKKSDEMALPSRIPTFAEHHEAATPFQITKQGADERRLMQSALIVLAATGIAIVLFWCLIVPS